MEVTEAEVAVAGLHRFIPANAYVANYDENFVTYYAVEDDTGRLHYRVKSVQERINKLIIEN